MTAGRFPGERGAKPRRDVDIGAQRRLARGDKPLGGRLGAEPLRTLIDTCTK
jgi:hypothetical protein